MARFDYSRAPAAKLRAMSRRGARRAKSTLRFLVMLSEIDGAEPFNSGRRAVR